MEISPHLLLCVLLQRLTARMSGVCYLYKATPPHFACMYVAFPHVMCSLHVYTDLYFDGYTLKWKRCRRTPCSSSAYCYCIICL